MIISYNWLLEYLPKHLPVNELSQILTSIGLEVEAVQKTETIPGSLDGLVIGEVITCQKHPNADKLSITTVNIGKPGPLHIVCGAPNVAAGQKVVVAPVGATVHPTGGEPFLIKKAKIRGEESAGMICAEDEIGLGTSHAGIIILPDDAIPGTLAKEYYKIPTADFAIHIGLTPNRSDANSHIGVARDVCAYLTHNSRETQSVQIPVSESLHKVPGTGSKISVHIDAPEACLRYAGICINNINVLPSPEWLKQRLNTIGMRSINNIVDITNYVLHEYGQPLHAFDADMIGNGAINVRFLPESTPFLCLDGVERKLQHNDLVICDSNGPMAIGGVFGGLTSGIGDTTINIFIESAYFDPKHIRRTSLYHGLRTDAAQHFEKGVDINNIISALQRAASLILKIAGGEIASEIIDVFPAPVPSVSVAISYNYIQKLSGKSYTTYQIKQILAALGFIIEHETNDDLTVRVPSNKPDISQPADIVEEILRIDGLDNISIPQRLNISLLRSLPNDREIRERIAEMMCGMGLQEIVTNSIVNSKNYPERTDLVKMINSLSSELDVMRPSMTECGLEVINYNCNRKNNDLALFEFGNIYYVKDEKYIQESRLAIWITGNFRAAHREQKAQQASIYYLKGIINNLIDYSGIKNISYLYTKDEITVKWKNQALCVLKEVPVTRLNEFSIKQDVFTAEIFWDNWVKASAVNKIAYKEVPKFPSVQRDLAIVLDVNIQYREIMEATEQLSLDALHSFDLFDIFESEKLGIGKKSFALNYIFQLQDRTLTDAEVEHLMNQLADVYKNKFNAQIRE